MRFLEKGSGNFFNCNAKKLFNVDIKESENKIRGGPQFSFNFASSPPCGVNVLVLSALTMISSFMKY